MYLLVKFWPDIVTVKRLDLLYSLHWQALNCVVHVPVLTCVGVALNSQLSCCYVNWLCSPHDIWCIFRWSKFVLRWRLVLWIRKFNVHYSHLYSFCGSFQCHRLLWPKTRLQAFSTALSALGTSTDVERHKPHCCRIKFLTAVCKHEFLQSTSDCIVFKNA